MSTAADSSEPQPLKRTRCHQILRKLAEPLIAEAVYLGERSFRQRAKLARELERDKLALSINQPFLTALLTAA